MSDPSQIRVAVIGATGFVGAQIAAEAARRGHAVTRISRSVRDGEGGGRSVALDVFDEAALAESLVDHDVVVHAYNPGRGSTAPDVYDTFVAGHRAIIAATLAARIPRLLCVGGAGSLLTRSGIPLLESDEWPRQFDIYRPSVMATRELYYLLRDTPAALDWVFLAPASMLTEEAPCGDYRIGTDHLLYDSNGDSRIAVGDYAAAMIDELERPRHHRQRFTVGY